MKKGIKMKCPKCAHEWLYKGSSKYYVCCARCKYSIKLFER